MKIRIIILFPFTLIYRIVLLIRSCLFKCKVLKSESFSIPIIGVGNLSAGGTGKTPHTAYIAELLSSNGIKTAILSRGYKRQTKGYIEAKEGACVEDLGDEPLQYFHHFGNRVLVCVCEKRRIGIRSIQKDHPDIQAIVLDDSFQHRYVKPGLNVLLSDYHHLYYKDHLLPGGMLREPRKEAKRADCIVVSKCPKILSPIIIRDIEEHIKPKNHQQIFYSYLEYLQPKKLFDDGPEIPEKFSFFTVFMLAGVANPYPLEKKLRSICEDFHPYTFSDHHQFTLPEISKLREDFVNHLTGNKAIITTEKDAQRLRNDKLKEILLDLPVFYYPIQVAFHEKGPLTFEQKILDYAKSHQTNS